MQSNTFLQLPVLVLGFLLSSAGCSRSAETGAELPAIPEPAVTDFAVPVQQQIMNAYARLQAKPRDATANASLGRILHAYKLLPWAINCYERARILNPADFSTAYYLGIADTQSGAYSAAIANLREVLRLAPEYAPARLRLAELLFKTGEPEEARTLFEDLLETDPDSPWAHHELALVLDAQGEPQAAIAHQHRALELFGSFAAAHYALALAYREQGDTEQAAWHLARYREQPQGAPPHVDPLLEAVFELDISASAEIGRARRLDAAGQRADAVVALERAAAIEPQSIEAHSQLIRLYGARDDFDRAQQHYEAVMALDPTAVEANLWFGECLARKGRLGEAADIFKRVLQTSPDHAMAHALLGQAYEEMQRPRDAERHYRLALESDPHNRQAKFLLGRYLARTGRHEEARPLQENLALPAGPNQEAGR